MKNYASCISSVLITFFVSSLACAQAARDETPTVGRGTVLTYSVKENRKSFNYIVTITTLDKKADIAFDWKTDETSPRKGHSSMNYGNLGSATSLLVNMKEGNETLGKDETRIFLSYPMTEHIRDHLSEFKVEGVAKRFLFVDLNYETKKIAYNDKQVDFRTHSGEDTHLYIDISDVGDLSLLSHYYSPDLELNLVDIHNKGLSMDVPVSDEKNNEKGQPKKMGSIDFIFAKGMYPTLALIENYDPTNGGKLKQPFRETYDYRLESNGDVPPSYIDVFIVDLKYIFDHKAKFSKYITGDYVIRDNFFDHDEILKVLDVFMNVDASDLYGYRPWADQQFVKSLSEEDRKKLASDASGYIMLHGFKEK